jgi:hypothetical protein
VIAVKSSNQLRLQLLLLSKDLVHMERMKAMLHAHGIHTITEPTSPQWSSAGWESFVMVSTEDYKKASTLCRAYEIGVAFTGGSHLVSTEVDQVLPAGVRR